MEILIQLFEKSNSHYEIYVIEMTHCVIRILENLIYIYSLIEMQNVKFQKCKFSIFIF